MFESKYVPMKKIYLIALLSFNALWMFAQVDKDTTWEFFRFDSSNIYLQIDTTSSNNIWQVGQPSKTFFDSAYSPVNAIVTDTINSYPVNNHSAFDIYIGEFNNP